MTRRLPIRLAWAIGAAFLLATPAAATPITLSQAQLLATADVTSFFGGNGQVLSRTADGTGVLFEIEGGTIDYGKVALRLRLNGLDLSAYDAFGLHVDVVSAPDPVEVNPFIQTGPTGLNFFEDVPGTKVQGDSFDSFVSLTGIPQLDDTYALGFQYFTSTGVIDPAAQTVLIRISPIPGADFPATGVSSPPPVPEAGRLLLLLCNAAALCVARRETVGGKRLRRVVPQARG